MFELGSASMRVLEVPKSHKRHIAYHFADHNVAFVEDTLFALGCGRMFEEQPSKCGATLRSNGIAGRDVSVLRS